jgi:long-subunit fatty acid transport protein
MKIHYLIAFRIFFILFGVNFVLLVAPLSLSHAKRLEMTSSPNPVGSGARAMGMGGAFIAVADDATAASWNPGGLIQLEKPEVSFVGASFHRTEDNTFGTNPEASGNQSVYEVDVNYFSIAYPFTVFEKNMIVSLNYQYLYDFTREWEFRLFERTAILEEDTNIHYEQEGGLSAIGLAYCIQVHPRFSIGFTLNAWEDWLGDNGWEQINRENGNGILLGITPYKSESLIRDCYSFRGFNANIGILWNITGKLTMGAVLKTPFTADLEHESSFSSSTRYADPTFNTAYSGGSISDEELDMPMSYGIGFAYRFSDKLTVAADVYRTEWQDFILTDSEGNQTSLISGAKKSESDIDPTHQVRVGAEYLFIGKKYIVPLRGGLFYDPAPAEGNPDNYFGCSLGSGIAIGRYIFDIAYQFRFGNDVGESILGHMEFSQDIYEHTVYLSLIVHF